MSHSYSNDTMIIPQSAIVLSSQQNGWRRFAGELLSALKMNSSAYLFGETRTSTTEIPLGDDGLQAAWETIAEIPETIGPRVLPLVSLLLLCRTFETAERLRAVLDPEVSQNAGVTVISTGSGVIANEITELLRGHVLQRSDWKAGNPVAIFTEGEMADDFRGRRTAEILPGLSASLCEALLAPTPTICIVPSLTVLPASLRALVSAHVALSPLDRDVVSAFFDHRFPNVGHSGRVFPENEMLARLSVEALVLAARGVTPDGVVAALHAAGTERGQKGALFREFPIEENVKEPLMRMLADLKDWQDGKIGWEDVSRGFLLCGPPGSGKTEIARALAREAGVRVVSGSLAKWIAEGPRFNDLMKAMRGFFADAAAKAPSIAFLDELDAFGDRGRRVDHNSAYTDSVVTALLECLDGFDEMEGVVVIGATNHVDKIDAAIRRPGRFDKVLHVRYPSADLMPDVIRLHLGALLKDQDLSRLAARAAGLSGAAIAALVREAKSRARAEKRALYMSDLEQSLAAIRPDMPASLLRRIAVHEAGHAIVATALHAGAVTEIRLANGGGETAIKVTQSAQTRAEILRHICVDMAGRAAEQLILGTVSGGAGGADESDLACATTRALALERSLGLGDNGALWYEDVQSALFTLPRDPGLQKRVQSLLQMAHEKAEAILQENQDVLQALAEKLAKQTLLTGAELDEALAKVTAMSGHPSWTSDLIEF